MSWVIDLIWSGNPSPGMQLIAEVLSKNRLLGKGSRVTEVTARPAGLISEGFYNEAENRFH